MKRDLEGDERMYSEIFVYLGRKSAWCVEEDGEMRSTVQSKPAERVDVAAARRARQSRGGSRAGETVESKGRAPAKDGMAATPRMVAQREQLRSMFGDAIQREVGAEEDELQLKVALGVLQRQGAEEEELLQGRFATVQKQGTEEDELVQGRFAPVQRQGAEEDELLQARRATVQRQNPEEEEQLQRTVGAEQLQAGLEDEEPFQGRAATAQRQTAEEEEEPLQGRFETAQRQGAVEEELEMKAAPAGPAQKPTMQLKDGVPVNDDSGLEREADVMGEKALAPAAQLAGGLKDVAQRESAHAVIHSPRLIAQLGSTRAGLGSPRVTAYRSKFGGLFEAAQLHSDSADVSYRRDSTHCAEHAASKPSSSIIQRKIVVFVDQRPNTPEDYPREMTKVKKGSSNTSVDFRVQPGSRGALAEDEQGGDDGGIRILLNEDLTIIAHGVAIAHVARMAGMNAEGLAKFIRRQLPLHPEGEGYSGTVDLLGCMTGYDPKLRRMSLAAEVYDRLRQEYPHIKVVGYRGFMNIGFNNVMAPIEIRSLGFLYSNHWKKMVAAFENRHQRPNVWKELFADATARGLFGPPTPVVFPGAAEDDPVAELKPNPYFQEAGSQVE